MTVDTSVELARAILAVHVDSDGFCDGCLNCWARLAPFPCSHARYARLVLASCASQPAGEKPINVGSGPNDRQ